MAQITNGIRSILSLPSVYTAFQNLVGAERSRRKLSSDHIRAKDGDVLLDVGCGPAEILDHIDAKVTYYGFDLSPSYIEAAKRKHGARGTFQCRDVTALRDDELPPCDIALAVGLLHHLDDDDATRLLANLHSRLAPGGRVITVDGAFYSDQSAIARYVLSRDRGQNVREGEAYRALVPSAYSDVKLTRREDLLHIPYTIVVLECTK